MRLDLLEERMKESTLHAADAASRRRRVGPKRQPGRGKNRAGADLDPTPASERTIEIHTPHQVPVRGRKKPPSEMHIRHPGG